MFKKAIQFINECKIELKDKTTWPTKEQVMNTTITVIISLAIASLVFFLVDVISDKVIRLITVTEITEVRKIVTPLTYVLFLVGMILFLVIGGKIKKRMSRY